jgi:hypothetical protein
MLHALLVEPLGQIVRHVTRTIVAEKPWPVRDGDVVKAGYSECLVEGGCDVGSAHGGTKPPGHDVAREVVKHGREIVPPPSGDLEVGEVGLPELTDGRRLVLELVRGLDHHIGRAGDEVMRQSWPRLFGQRPAGFKWIPAGLC